jgi:hypothetical protein
MKQLRPIAFLLAICLLAACSNKLAKIAQSPDYQFNSKAGDPDYSQLQYWAAHPQKHDPSDSVPASLLADYRPDSTVDIFFVHPTSYTKEGRELGWNATIDNAELNAKTDYGSILFQASVFNAAGRVFAPRYRQAHLSAYYPKDAADSAGAMAAFELAYKDVKTAFDYYLAHENKGRPMIIASHSQGSTHAKRLLKEYFDNQTLKNRLVVAYVVGMALDPAMYSSIPVCSNPNQTGCIAAWRTYQTDYKPEFVLKENFVSAVTNPLTWDANAAIASRDLNKGGILLKFNKAVPRVASAQVAGGVLWTEKPHFFGRMFYTTKNYHIADYNLYYQNIRENASQRISAFWKR